MAVGSEPAFVLVGMFLLGGLLESNPMGRMTLAAGLRCDEGDRDVWLASALDEALWKHPWSSLLTTLMKED